MSSERALSILLVDDHQDGADSLSLLLGIQGFEVHVVYNSMDALAAAEARLPDVLISDIGIPRLDGCELAKSICALNGPKPLMIAMTGYNEERARCLESGFDHFFLKPADPNAIITLLRAAKT
jgi:CheY-like chemotaxis protein